MNTIVYSHPKNTNLLANRLKKIFKADLLKSHLVPAIKLDSKVTSQQDRIAFAIQAVLHELAKILSLAGNINDISYEDKG